MLLRYELFDFFTQTIVGFYDTEMKAHENAKGLDDYEITLCYFSIEEITRIQSWRFQVINSELDLLED